MREELAKIAGKRRRFEAVFDKFGKKAGYKGTLTTILLIDVARAKVSNFPWNLTQKRN